MACPNCDVDIEDWWVTKMDDFAVGRLPDLLVKTAAVRLPSH